MTKKKTRPVQILDETHGGLKKICQLEGRKIGATADTAVKEWVERKGETCVHRMAHGDLSERLVDGFGSHGTGDE